VQGISILGGKGIQQILEAVGVTSPIEREFFSKQKNAKCAV